MVFWMHIACLYEYACGRGFNGSNVNAKFRNDHPCVAMHSEANLSTTLSSTVHRGHKQWVVGQHCVLIATWAEQGLLVAVE
jgi:hypothetical protein